MFYQKLSFFIISIFLFFSCSQNDDKGKAYVSNQKAKILVIDLNNFEVVILEVSIHQYNKDAPLFDQVLDFMKKKNFKLYDIFDLKRLGYQKSFLLQFDCIFVRNDSKLLKVNF